MSEFSDIDWDNGMFGDLLVWNSRTKYLGQMRVFTKAVILWNIALDEYQGPKVRGSLKQHFCVKKRILNLTHYNMTRLKNKMYRLKCMYNNWHTFTGRETC